ncbi:MAG: phosphoadenosine phosphosulfate reductase [Anaerotignum sp.]|nr:phosphoadenosine phosphosulfate reductase [Anaerotignum sp.]
MRKVIQLSGGKDSLALLLISIEKGYKFDEAVYFDVGEWEFQAVRRNIEKAKKLCEEKGIQFTTIHPPIEFPTLAWEREYIQRNGNKKKGYEWCGWHGCRWGTTQKTSQLDKYCGDNLQIIGIAKDEPERLEKGSGNNKAYWLAEWGLTEADCLKYCYDQGWNWLEYEPLTGEWIELYSVLDRVSCWCCGNKNLKELYNIYRFLPSYWKKLEEYQRKTDKPFKRSGSVFELAERFELGCITKFDLKKFRRGADTNAKPTE